MNGIPQKSRTLAEWLAIDPEHGRERYERDTVREDRCFNCDRCAHDYPGQTGLISCMVCSQDGCPHEEDHRNDCPRRDEVEAMMPRLLDERRLVEAFATHGGSKLAKRRHHGRWVEDSIEDITNNLLDEIQEMLDSHTREEARAECIDVALSAMILWDRLGREGE